MKIPNEDQNWLFDGSKCKRYNPNKEIYFDNFPPDFYYIYDNRKYFGSNKITYFTRRLNYFADKEIDPYSIKFSFGEFKDFSVRQVAKINPEYLTTFIETYENNPVFMSKNKELVNAVYYEILRLDLKNTEPIAYKRYLMKIKKNKIN